MESIFTNPNRSLKSKADHILIVREKNQQTQKYIDDDDGENDFLFWNYYGMQLPPTHAMSTYI